MFSFMTDVFSIQYCYNRKSSGQQNVRGKEQTDNEDTFILITDDGEVWSVGNN